MANKTYYELNTNSPAGALQATDKSAIQRGDDATGNALGTDVSAYGVASRNIYDYTTLSDMNAAPSSLGQLATCLQTPGIIYQWVTSPVPAWVVNLPEITTANTATMGAINVANLLAGTKVRVITPANVGVPILNYTYSPNSGETPDGIRIIGAFTGNFIAENIGNLSYNSNLTGALGVGTQTIGIAVFTNVVTVTLQSFGSTTAAGTESIVGTLPAYLPPAAGTVDLAITVAGADSVAGSTKTCGLIRITRGQFEIFDAGVNGVNQPFTSGLPVNVSNGVFSYQLAL